MKIHVETSEKDNVYVTWREWEADTFSLLSVLPGLIPVGGLTYWLCQIAWQSMGPSMAIVFPFIVLGSTFIVYRAIELLLCIKAVPGHRNYVRRCYVVVCMAVKAPPKIYARRNRFTYLQALFPVSWLGEGNEILNCPWHELLGFSVSTSAFHLPSAANMPVEQIVQADLGEGFSQTVCLHYGAPSEVAELRAILQREFVTKRPETITIAGIGPATDDDPI